MDTAAKPSGWRDVVVYRKLGSKDCIVFNSVEQPMVAEIARTMAVQEHFGISPYESETAQKTGHDFIILKGPLPPGIYYFVTEAGKMPWTDQRHLLATSGQSNDEETSIPAEERPAHVYPKRKRDEELTKKQKQKKGKEKEKALESGPGEEEEEAEEEPKKSPPATRKALSSPQHWKFKEREHHHYYWTSEDFRILIEGATRYKHDWNIVSKSCFKGKRTAHALKAKWTRIKADPATFAEFTKLPLAVVKAALAPL
jgi:hypothetical protein